MKPREDVHELRINTKHQGNDKNKNARDNDMDNAQMHTKWHIITDKREETSIIFTGDIIGLIKLKQY